ncbi:hypothetical protein TVAG_307170 [Trichomonas vaginalis G3]|uniref:Uncharacterized protein n=1 Tax=Trichomonas vaginalis (strain ATCC PRA-98 / G3) TaxID=412133 RepID=A2FMC1_TRIV3|nr:protein ubiquitination [Trichomonas vaginalis G3]EAX93938.1 hypothetical protein TVAG_307170 [Trichomonas vaginalis G3]KAI5549069.1 protein ubiquitination [Trichomonas vaginalis G3]|eukprot:XP_001306868.1 hypothetical protein [Trichomonas vaginalis G3]
MDLNFEYIAAHISDYINNENFFDTFDIEDIKTIMKHSRLTADQYVCLLKQSSSTINARKLYTCTLNANVTIKNFEEIVSILKSIKKYMKFSIFDGIIDFLKHNEKVINPSTYDAEIFQDKSKSYQNENKNSNKDKIINVTNENNDHSRDILTKITELKKSNDFQTVYKFLDELSSYGNHEMISKSIEAGLWQKITPNKDKYGYNRNVLYFAIENGNFRLVQSLMECGCDIETKHIFRNTPLIHASEYGQLDVVQYLISVGADKEAKDNSGSTPLICASYDGQLAVVQYLISAGANKEAKNDLGCTPLALASQNGKLDVVQYLISVGANNETKTESGSTPLIHASINGHLDVVQYLISVGANKKAMNNYGKTALMVAKGDVWDYLKAICAN